MRRFLIFTVLALVCQHAIAHQGGHGNAGEAGSTRTWRFKNKTQAATGSFLLVKNDKVFIEQSGNVVSFALDAMSWVDQHYVKRRLEKIGHINARYHRHASINAKTSWRQPLLTRVFAGVALLLSVFCCVLFSIRHKKTAFMALGVTALFFLVMVSCNGDEDDAEVLVSGTSNPAVIDLAFTAYKPAVTTRWDDNYFYVESNGIPTHQMMVGITNWIAQVPIPYPYTGKDAWSIPLNTKYASNPVSIANDLRKGAIAIAANGIPIFNPVNASGLVSNEIGELDTYGGHSGRGDDYHYHTAPLHLQSTSGNYPIAYGLDGYPVYGTTEPDGSVMKSLDDFHGHEYTDGQYHYHGTATYPYMIAKMRGEVTLDGTSPETQIRPQPVAKALRSNPHPINGANLVITDLIQNQAKNGYLLKYTIGGKAGSVDYTWTESNFFTFTFHDVSGTTAVETFQR
jgi:hypothetical protein